MIVTTAPDWSTSAPDAGAAPLPTEPCEDLFRVLLRRDPKALVSLLSAGTLEPHLLTYAAEIAGEAPVGVYPELRTALLALLEHPDAPVREGAIYGLTKMLSVLPHLERHIRRHADASESSPGVRAAARSVLGEVA